MNFNVTQTATWEKKNPVDPSPFANGDKDSIFVEGEEIYCINDGFLSREMN